MTSSPPYHDGQRLTLEGLALRLRVNRRARRVSIRIDVRSGEAVATAPSERTLKDAVAFAGQRRDWIAERLAQRPTGTPIAPGQALMLHGAPVRLEAVPGASAARLARDSDGARVIRSGGEGEAFSRRVLNLMKAEARRALEARTAAHLATLELKPVRISIGDPGSRWGSCSPHNWTIRYSWRVIMAPPEVLDYLAAHEVAHLVHANHSPAYWAVVTRLVGDHRPFRQWLRDNGAALHAVGR
jgi:predicted metal-dependent hydrolase